MPVLFDGSTDFLTLPLVIAPPFFMSVWVRPDIDSRFMVPMWLGDTGIADKNDYTVFVPHDLNNNVWYDQRNSDGDPGQGPATGTSYWVAGTWMHVVVATDPNGGMSMWVDGVQFSSASIPDAVLPAGIDTIGIARRVDSAAAGLFQGAVTRPALHAGLPTRFVIDQLAAGAWPARVRPADLKYFVPMVGSDLGHVDLVTSVAMTETGTPTTVADPPGLEVAPGVAVVVQTKPAPVAGAPVVNENASATVTATVTVVAGEHLIAVVHGHSGTASTAISVLSSDLDGAFTVDLENNWDAVAPGQYTGIGRLMNATPGEHVITATLSGPPVATAIAVYRVTGLAASPIFDAVTKQGVSLTIDEEIMAYCDSEPGTLAIVGSTTAQPVTDPSVADTAVGTEAYDTDWASLDGEYWGLSVDVSAHVEPRTGLQHPEATPVRGYAIATVVYEGVASLGGGSGNPVPLLGVG